jgi:hypothetical protein
LNELEGLKGSDLIEIAKENKANFAAWMRVYEQGPESGGLIGVVRTSDYEIEGLLLIEFDEGRVLDTDIVERISLVSFPATDDWDSTSIGMIFEDVDGDLDYEPISRGDIAGLPMGEMVLSNWLSLALDGVRIQILAGEDPKIQSLALEDFQQRDLRVYNGLMEWEGQVATAAMMLRRSKTFGASTVIPVTLGERYRELGNLRETIIQALNSAVKRDGPKRQALAGENFSESNWGMLAAAALSEKFRFDDFLVSPDLLESSIVFSYLNQETADTFMANLILGREQATPQAMWRITGLSLRPFEEAKSVSLRDYLPANLPPQQSLRR